MKLVTREIDTEVLIVGGGGAGAMAAIKAKEAGVETLAMTKGVFPSGNTSVALAGYAVALGHADERDNPQVHFEDVIRAGAGLNNRRMVKAWIEKIVELTWEMDKWGIDLIKEDGKFAQRPWAEHTYPRMVHQNLTTGKAVIQCLRKRSRAIGVEALENTLVGGLLKAGNRMAGAWGIDYRTGEFLVCRAKAVILTTGGLGHLFPVADNFKTITGEGYSMAFRAGAEIMDLEMMHFLPTLCSAAGVQLAGGPHVFLRSLIELLNNGARLYNGLGERYMKRLYPDAGEKEKIEKQVTQGIGLEVCEGRGTPRGTVYLDLTGIPQDRIEKAFPQIWKKIAGSGVDLAYQPLEMATYPHDSLGGVRINEKGQSNVPGLFAAGEAAAGSHGAARIGGSALADALAFGAIAAKSAVDYAKRFRGQPSPDKREIAKVKRRLDTLTSSKQGVAPSELRKTIQGIAHRYLNTVRNEKGLKTALAELEQLEKQMLPKLSAAGANQKERLTALREALEVDGQLELAKLIATAALRRKESRGGSFGGHYRSDYPEPDDKKWLKNVILKRSDKGAITVRTASPVMA